MVEHLLNRLNAEKRWHVISLHLIQQSNTKTYVAAKNISIDIPFISKSNIWSTPVKCFQFCKNVRHHVLFNSDLM